MTEEEDVLLVETTVLDVLGLLTVMNVKMLLESCPIVYVSKDSGITMENLVTLVNPSVLLVLTPPLVTLVLIPPEIPLNVNVMPENGITTEFVPLVNLNVKLVPTEILVTLVKKKLDTYPTVNVKKDTMIPPEPVNPWKNVPKWNSTLSKMMDVPPVKSAVKLAPITTNVLPDVLENVLKKI